MKKTLLTNIVLLLCMQVYAQSSSYEQRVKAYIDQYKQLAVSEQKRSGIPAAIKLAQGIHETMAGNSELALNANNHFGIKCKKEWTGQTYAYTDDAPNECFRKYQRAEESYKDHSDYLMKSPRYAELFKLSITDYAAWATGLKRCGYATNPRYAQVLIKLIEDYRLQEYTYAALNNTDVELVSPNRKAEVIPEEDAREVPTQKAGGMSAATNSPKVIPVPVVTTPVATTTAKPAVSLQEVPKQVVIQQPTVAANQPIAEVKEETFVEEFTPSMPKPAYGQLVRANGLKAIYGRKGDTPLEYAYKTSMRYQKLLELNEIDERPLPHDMYLYLERKNTTGVRPTHVVKTGETTFSIAQDEGLFIKSLMDMNMLQPGEEPYPGTILELQKYRTSKPVVVVKKKETPVAYVKPTAYPQAVPVSPTTGTVATKSVVTKPSNIVVNENVAPAIEKRTDLVAKEMASKPAVIAVEAATTTQAVEVKEIVKPDTIAQVAAPANEKPVLTIPTKEEAKPIVAAPVPAIATEAKEIPVATAPAKEVPVVAAPVVAQPVAKDTTTIAAPTLPLVEEAKPLPKVEIEPVAAATKTTTMPTAKPETAAPKQVAVPVIEEEPKDELDRLKKKFDKVVYAKDNVRTATPAQPVTTAAPKVDTIKASTPVAKPEEKIQPLAPSKDPSKYHLVKKGETGFAIAQKYGITVKQLNEWNALNFGAIQEGQKLRIKP